MAEQAGTFRTGRPIVSRWRRCRLLVPEPVGGGGGGLQRRSDAEEAMETLIPELSLEVEKLLVNWGGGSCRSQQVVPVAERLATGGGRQFIFPTLTLLRRRWCRSAGTGGAATVIGGASSPLASSSLRSL